MGIFGNKYSGIVTAQQERAMKKKRIEQEMKRPADVKTTLYHINKYGEVAECFAMQGRCPYTHFPTREQAIAYADYINEQENTKREYDRIHKEWREYTLRGIRDASNSDLSKLFEMAKQARSQMRTCEAEAINDGNYRESVKEYHKAMIDMMEDEIYNIDSLEEVKTVHDWKVQCLYRYNDHITEICKRCELKYPYLKDDLLKAGYPEQMLPHFGWTSTTYEEEMNRWLKFSKHIGEIMQNAEYVKQIESRTSRSFIVRLARLNRAITHYNFCRDKCWEIVTSAELDFTKETFTRKFMRYRKQRLLELTEMTEQAKDYKRITESDSIERTYRRYIEPLQYAEGEELARLANRFIDPNVNVPFKFSERQRAEIIYYSIKAEMQKRNIPFQE